MKPYKIHIGNETIECEDAFTIPDEGYSNMPEKHFEIKGEEPNTFEYYLKRKGVFYFRNRFGMFSVKDSQLLDLPLKYGDRIDVKVS